MGIKWPKQPDYLVQAVQISLFYDFTLNNVAYFGSATGRARGYNLAQVSIAGQLRSVQGDGTTNITQTCTFSYDLALELLGYNMAAFEQAAQ